MRLHLLHPQLLHCHGPWHHTNFLQAIAYFTEKSKVLSSNEKIAQFNLLLNIIFFLEYNFLEEVHTMFLKIII